MGTKGREAFAFRYRDKAANCRSRSRRGCELGARRRSGGRVVSLLSSMFMVIRAIPLTRQRHAYTSGRRYTLTPIRPATSRACTLRLLLQADSEHSISPSPRPVNPSPTRVCHSERSAPTSDSRVVQFASRPILPSVQEQKGRRGTGRGADPSGIRLAAEQRLDSSGRGDSFLQEAPGIRDAQIIARIIGINQRLLIANNYTERTVPYRRLLHTKIYIERSLLSCSTFAEIARN